jgi:hypothetical protein
MNDVAVWPNSRNAAWMMEGVNFWDNGRIFQRKHVASSIGARVPHHDWLARSAKKSTIFVGTYTYVLRLQMMMMVTFYIHSLITVFCL